MHKDEPYIFTFIPTEILQYIYTFFELSNIFTFSLTSKTAKQSLMNFLGEKTTMESFVHPFIKNVLDIDVAQIAQPENYSVNIDTSPLIKSSTILKRKAAIAEDVVYLLLDFLDTHNEAKLLYNIVRRYTILNRDDTITTLTSLRYADQIASAYKCPGTILNLARNISHFTNQNKLHPFTINLEQFPEKTVSGDLIREYVAALSGNLETSEDGMTIFLPPTSNSNQTPGTTLFSKLFYEALDLISTDIRPELNKVKHNPVLFKEFVTLVCSYNLNAFLKKISEYKLFSLLFSTNTNLLKLFANQKLLWIIDDYKEDFVKEIEALPSTPDLLPSALKDIKKVNLQQKPIEDKLPLIDLWKQKLIDSMNLPPNVFRKSKYVKLFSNCFFEKHDLVSFLYSSKLSHKLVLSLINKKICSNLEDAKRLVRIYSNNPIFQKQMTVRLARCIVSASDEVVEKVTDLLNSDEKFTTESICYLFQLHAKFDKNEQNFIEKLLCKFNSVQIDQISNDKELRALFLLKQSIESSWFSKFSGNQILDLGYNSLHFIHELPKEKQLFIVGILLDRFKKRINLNLKQIKELADKLPSPVVEEIIIPVEEDVNLIQHNEEDDTEDKAAIIRRIKRLRSEINELLETKANKKPHIDEKSATFDDDVVNGFSPAR